MLVTKCGPSYLVVVAHALRLQRLQFVHEFAGRNDANVAGRGAQSLGQQQLELAAGHGQRRGDGERARTAVGRVVDGGAHLERGNAVLGKVAVGAQLVDGMVLQFGQRHAAAVGGDVEGGCELGGQGLRGGGRSVYI